MRREFLNLPELTNVAFPISIGSRYFEFYMSPKESPPPAFDADQYKPTEWAQVVYLEGPAVPKREFEGKETARWLASMTLQGVIVINMIHKDFPHAICQVQCCPDDKGTYHAFMVHWPPIEGDHTGVHIPEELAEEMFFALFPQVMSQLQEKGGRLA